MEQNEKHQHLDALAKRILKEAEFKYGTPKGDQITVDVGGKIFEKTLPEGITLNQVKSVQAHIRDFATAAAMACGEDAAKHIKKHSDINAITYRTDMGHQRSHSVISAKKEVHNPMTGQSTTVHGHVGIRISTGLPGGQIIHARASVANAFAKAGLGK